jgi:hypothetical protein
MLTTAQRNADEQLVAFCAFTIDSVHVLEECLVSGLGRLDAKQKGQTGSRTTRLSSILRFAWPIFRLIHPSAAIARVAVATVITGS